MLQHKLIRLSTKYGQQLQAFENDSITKEIQKCGEYDRNTLNSIREVLSLTQPETSLDVGANIGNHSLVIAQYTKQLIAFEPVPLIYNVLKENFELNQLNNAVALNSGLSNQVSERTIFIPTHGNLGCSSLEASFEQSEKQQITTIVGDHYINTNFPSANIDFIKMDVEGHEASALLGLESTIKGHQPLLLVEYKSVKTIEAFKRIGLFDRLFEGYQFFSLSYTHNKKVHKKNITGFLKRIYYKIFDQRWCLSKFNDSMAYSNIYLVPPRYKKVFTKFNFFDPE